MDWKDWEPIYHKILEEFDYDRTRDERAAHIALNLTKNRIESCYLKKLISRQVVSICGAGESLEADLHKIAGVIIAADEATSTLLNNDIIPDIVITDLDGFISDIIKAGRKGSLIIVHAHGDNIPALETYIPLLGDHIMLTTQSTPFDGVYNFGGFTDGDRAYCLANHFKAKKILLIGFDFSHPKIKKGKDLMVKQRKLQWAKKIIEALQ
jgi:uncharacterized Rossmann fold enzyme